MREMQQVFGLPKELELVDITVVDEVLAISAVSTQVSPCCPLCGVHASRIPSTYRRQMADVPCGGQYVRLLVQVRKRASRRSPQTSPLRTRGASLTIPWWIAGGWALDLFLGVQTREHHDIDIQILRRDQQAVRALLQQWDIQGRALQHPWDLEVTSPTLNLDTLPFQRWEPDMLLGKGAYDIFCRPQKSGPWAFQLMVGDSSEDQWLFRRDGRVRRPIASIGSVTTDGIPYMAPEIQLLYKAKAPRPQDEADFARTLPHLSQASRTFLVQALALVYPSHRWLLELEGS